jgi:hypothetical protein
LVIVLLIVGLISALIIIRAGAYTFWEEEGQIRRLSELVSFLHHQAVADQALYQLEFDVPNRAYRVNVMKDEGTADQNLIEIAQDAGNLSLELAAMLSPSMGETYSTIPPPNFPSLADPQRLPADMTIEDIRTMRGVYGPADPERPYVLFWPRGFSEFAVLHLRLSSGKPVTILVNPFTGNTETYREYRDFEWTYGKNKNKAD